MRHYNIPVFIVHYGCPHMCVFCNQAKITGRETNIEPDEIRHTIDEYLETLNKNSIKEVAFFGGTFTAISLKLQREYLEVVKEYIDRGLVDGIRLSTRPDCINDEILILLKKYGVKTIELGVQSLNDEVLSLSERGYQKEKVKKASSLIKSYGIKLGIQLMPGLPGSNIMRDLETTKEVVEIKPDMVRIYPTLVISDTKLENMYLDGSFKPLDMDITVELVAKMIAYFELGNIEIIRVGLQPSDELREDGVIVAGPFHPAFRELVETKLYGDFFKALLKENDFLKIEVNPKMLSRAVGIKKANKLRFGSTVEIIGNGNLVRDELRINGASYRRDDILKNIIECGADETDNSQCRRL